MNWKKLLIIVAAVVGFGFVSAPRSEAGVRVGIGIGLPVGVGYGYGCDPYYGGPAYAAYGYDPYYYRHHRRYYRPRVYVRRHYHWRHGRRYVCTARHDRW